MQLISIEFAVNIKVYLATKIFFFITNYERELRMEVDIRRKSNKVCNKNETNPEGSQNSTKMSIRRDKEISK